MLKKQDDLEVYPDWPDILNFSKTIQKPSRPKTSNRIEFNNVGSGRSSNFSEVFHENGKSLVPDPTALQFTADSYFVNIPHKLLVNLPVCECQVACKRAYATKKCYSCVKYYPNGDGFYCDSCFDARHPEYRMKHSWAPVQSAKNQEQEWLRHLARHKLEQDLEELNLLISQTNDVVEEASALGKDFQEDKRIENGFNCISAIDTSIRNLVNHIQEDLKAGFLTKSEAANKIKEMWRVRTARKKLKEIIRSVYQEFEDPNTGKVYYYNTKTKETKWTKPLCLGSEDLTIKLPPKKVKKASEMSITEACIYIQKAYRSRRALQKMRELIQQSYTKHLDPNTNQYYYHNKKTGVVTWLKPKLLGNEDIDMNAKVGKKKKTLKPLTQDEAALKIQGMYKCNKSRKLFRKLLSSVYEKIQDLNTGKYYFHNTKTGNVTWVAPANFTESDILTPRSRKRQANNKPGTGKKTESKQLLTEDEAATIIQHAYRRRSGFLILLKLCRMRYEKIFDPSRNAYYYHNVQTGETSWTKPILLGKEEVYTPRTRQKDLKKDKNCRKGSRSWTEDEAARSLQGLYRQRKARHHLQVILKEAYEKMIDPSTGMSYYHNKKTGDVSWTKPLLLGNNDL